MKNTNSSLSLQITKKLNQLGDDHLLVENKYIARKEPLLYLNEFFTFTHLIKGEDYRANGKLFI